MDKRPEQLGQVAAGRELSLLAFAVLLSYVPVLYSRFALTDGGVRRGDSIAFLVFSGLSYGFMGAVAVALSMHSKRSSVFSIQWVAKPRRRDLVGAIGITIGVVATQTLLKFGLRRLHVGTNDSLLGLNLNTSTFFCILDCIIGVVCAPIAEEVFWRGYVQGALQRFFGGFASVVVQAILFALWHLRGLGGTILLLPLGLVAGMWRYRFRTLVPLMAAHAILNGFWYLGYWLNNGELRHVRITHNYGASLEALCTPMGTDPCENARLAYGRAALLFVDRPKELQEKDTMTWPGELSQEKMDTLRRWIATNEQALAEFEIGTGKPYYCPCYTRSCFDETMLGPLKSLTLATLSRAQMSAIDGNAAACITDVLRCFCLGRQLRGPMSLIDQLVGFAVSETTAERVLTVLKRVPTDRAVLAQLQSELEVIERDRPAPINFEGERLISYDLVQRTFTDDGDGGGHIPRATIESTVDPSSALRHLGIGPESDRTILAALERRQTVDLIDEVFTHLRWIPSRTPAEVHLMVGNLGEYVDKLTAENPLVSVCTSSFARAYELAYRSQAFEDALVVVTSVLRYRLEVGDLPNDLNSLVDKGYLKTLPTDPFGGSTFVYRKMGSDFLLYSLGSDFQDNGGVSIPHSGETEEANSDLVFWPVGRN